jgi:hypothetical protein
MEGCPLISDRWSLVCEKAFTGVQSDEMRAFMEKKQ